MLKVKNYTDLELAVSFEKKSRLLEKENKDLKAKNKALVKLLKRAQGVMMTTLYQNKQDDEDSSVIIGEVDTLLGEGKA